MATEATLALIADRRAAAGQPVDRVGIPSDVVREIDRDSLTGYTPEELKDK